MARALFGRRADTRVAARRCPLLDLLAGQPEHDMTRRIVTKSDVQALIKARPVNLSLLDVDARGQVKAAPPPDDYAARLLKLIPAEVVTVFVILDGVIRSASNQVPPIVYWVIFVLLVVGTYF